MSEGDSVKEKSSNTLRLLGQDLYFEDEDDLSIPSTSGLDDFASDSYSDYSSEFDTKKPKKSRKPQIYLKDIPLNLNCEWKECNFETSSMNMFIKHVSDHIPQVEIKKNQEDSEYYLCLWTDCNFDTENDKELCRHINYHSFHTKLKYLGSYMITHWNILIECRANIYGNNNLPDLTSEFVCLWENCLNVFTHPQLYFDHVRLHGIGSLNNDSNKKVDCKWLGCKATFKSEKLLIIHLKSHTQEKVIACPECGAFFTATTKLHDHLFRQSEELQYQCKLCSKYYATTRLLREHMRTHINNYKCVYCDMTCYKPHLLSRHILICHLDSKPFKCEFCEYKATSQQHINSHILTHYSHDNHQCPEPECDFTCRSAYGLKSHFEKKHEKGKKLLYSCHLCEEKFQRGAFLSKHLTSRHLIKKSNKDRFRYKLDEDGFYRLQTVRYTSWEGLEEIACSKETENDSQKTDKLNNRQVLISIEEMDENGEIRVVYEIPNRSP